MQIISQGKGTRPGGPVLQDTIRNSVNLNRRRNIAVHGTPGDNRDLQRLESFFGADSPYVARRHHRDSRWVDSSEVQDASLPEQPGAQEQLVNSDSIASPELNNQLPAINTEKLLEAPTAALERLTELTSQQMANLKNASQQAGEILNELKGTAEAGAGSILSNLEDAQRQLAPEVQSQVDKIGTVLEKQVNEAQDVLMQAVEAIKKQAQTLSQQVNAQLDSNHNANSSSQQQQRTTSTSTAAGEVTLASRFQTEMQQVVEQVQSLSKVQLKKLQEVVVSLERELVEHTNQIRSFISEKKVELNQTIGQKMNAANPPPAAPLKQQQQQQQKVIKSTPTSAQQRQAQASSSSGTPTPAPVQHLTKTAEAVKDLWRDKVIKIKNNINLPSISVPTPLANFDASKIKSIAANNPQAVALGASVLAVSALRLFLRSRANKDVQAEQNAIKRARSRRALDRQRNRFKQALGTDEEGSGGGGVDSSVFAAVQRIQSSSAAASADAATNSPTGAGNGQNNSDDDEQEDDEDEGGALGSDPESWDPAMKKQWNAFVKSSKLKDAALWDPNDVDEGLPEIYVDLDRD